MSDQDLTLEWLTDPFNVNEITRCAPAKYKRRVTDLNRRTMPGRPVRMYRGLL